MVDDYIYFEVIFFIFFIFVFFYEYIKNGIIIILKYNIFFFEYNKNKVILLSNLYKKIFLNNYYSS